MVELAEGDDRVYRVDREACRKVGLRSMSVTPLKHMDTTVGVRKVVAPEVGLKSARLPTTIFARSR